MEPSAFDFRFAVCLPLAQSLLKHEVSETHPELAAAFSRPGLVTWKRKALGTERTFAPRLARRSGLSLGVFRTLDELELLLLPHALHGLWLNVFVRPMADEREPEPSDVIALLETSLRARFEASGMVRPSTDQAAAGDLVLDIVVPPASSGEEPFFAGLSRVSAREAPRTSLLSACLPPEMAPSRAFAKLEEAIAWSRLPLERGQRVLELGSAPGGASLSLLERGLGLVAVDPAEMDPMLAVLAAKQKLFFRHVEKPAGKLDSGDLVGLGGRVDWLVSDMNLAPPVAVTQITHAWSLVKSSVRGAIVTLKMNDERAVSALSKAVERLGALFGKEPDVVCLPSHRREVAVMVRR